MLKYFPKHPPFTNIPEREVDSAQTKKDQALSKVFAEPNALRDKLGQVNVLLVGAGGIGCEVLKNLVLIGATQITVIDLDTIDVSNLNRQFLFQREHVGKPKALVAKETVLKFVTHKVDINAIHGSIFDHEFGVSYFQKFNVVINALDNLKARSHVNRMCLAADVPLIETGSAGYFGQVEYIKRNVTQCYDCTPKPKQRTFPGCTIRNTPSEPIHCIVWAKHLFNQLFGEYDHEDEVSPDNQDEEAAEKMDTTMDPQIDSTTDGPPAKMRKVDELNGKKITVNEAGDANDTPRVNTRQWAEKCNYDAQKLFQKFFVDDINYLLSMHNLWKERTPPKPSDIDIEKLDESVTLQYPRLDRTMKVWSAEMCAKVFADCCTKLSALLKTKADGEFLVWDKDDDVALDFVTACANIRSYAFSIAAKSRFDVKALAGNIIPAIATTNSVVAGVAVMYAIHVLIDYADKNKTMYLRKEPNYRGNLFGQEAALVPPKPDCLVCSNSPSVTVTVDLEKMTVAEFEKELLKDHFNMIAPDVTLGESIVLSSEEGETEQNMAKSLKDMKFFNGCVIDCDDFLQEYKLTMTILHEAREKKDAPPFKVLLNEGTTIKEKQSAEQIDAAKADLKRNESEKEDVKQDDDDDIMEVVEGDSNVASTSQKQDDDDDLVLVEGE